MRDPNDPLDDLLRAAEWPELPKAAHGRLLAQWEAISPARPRAPTWPALVVAAAAVIAGLSVGLWTMRPEPPTQVVEQPTPRPTELAKPPALPGRPATPLEKAWLALATRQPAAPTAPQPSPSAQLESAIDALRVGQDPPSLLLVDSRTLEALLTNRLLDEATTNAEAEAVTRLLAQTVGPSAAPRLLLEAEVYDDNADQWTLRPRVVEAIATLISPSDLADAIRSSQALGREHVLLAALARSESPSAADALIDLAALEPVATRATVADASPTVATGLLDRLDSPQIAVRHRAALLLSGSDDPRVYQAVAARLATNRSREAALRVLLQSHHPTAVEVLAQAQQSPALRALVRSLVSQGVAPPVDSDSQLQLLHV